MFLGLDSKVWEAIILVVFGIGFVLYLLWFIFCSEISKD